MKQIHVVFQVLNFIHGEASKKYNLMPIDKLILINFASHKGTKGIFPSQETIASELDISIRYVRERTKHLIAIDVLSVQKEGRKYKYDLKFLQELQFLNDDKIGEPQFRNQTHNDPIIPEPQFPYSEQQRNPSSPIYRNHSSGHSGTPVPTNNKVITKDNNKERDSGQARGEPKNSLSFEPDKNNQELASRLGLDLGEQLRSFQNRHRGEKNQYEFERWLKNGHEYANKKNGGSQEVRSTVPWFNGDDYWKQSAERDRLYREEQDRIYNAMMRKDH